MQVAPSYSPSISPAICYTQCWLSSFCLIREIPFIKERQLRSASISPASASIYPNYLPFLIFSFGKFQISRHNNKNTPPLLTVKIIHFGSSLKSGNKCPSQKGQMVFQLSALQQLSSLCWQPFYGVSGYSSSVTLWRWWEASLTLLWG